MKMTMKTSRDGGKRRARQTAGSSLIMNIRLAPKIFS
jgi:hypothetical protein